MIVQGPKSESLGSLRIKPNTIQVRAGPPIVDFINSSESLFNPVTLIPKATVAPSQANFVYVKGKWCRKRQIPIENWPHLNLKLSELLYARHSRNLRRQDRSLFRHIATVRSYTDQNTFTGMHPLATPSTVSDRTHGASSAIKVYTYSNSCNYSNATRQTP